MHIATESCPIILNCGDEMSIGERIIDLRRERNISQSQLAKLLEVTRQAVSKWENDLAAPDTIKLIQLADVLDTDVEYLATGNHQPVKTKTEVVTIEKPVEVIVEKVVEKPVTVEKIVEVPRFVESVVEKPVVRKVTRTKYIRNPIEFALVGLACFLVGLLIGLLF